MEQILPLVDDASETDKNTKNLRQRALRSADTLANHLPTGTVLVFQLLLPILTNEGDCNALRRYLAAALIVLCAVTCFLLSFTDSFKDKKGNVSYGIVTVHGLLVIDGSSTISPHLAAKYHLRFTDFIHAFLSMLVFATIALCDQTVISCFFPTQSRKTHEILVALPIVISVVCSVAFIVFPCQRHGIGFPVSSD